MPDFRVVIVGGGPVGLIASLVLSQASIDFVLLESYPEILKDTGASIILFPDSIRVLSQLGLLASLHEIGYEVLTWAEYTEQGRFALYSAADMLKRNHGANALMFHRADLMRLLYDSLDQEAKALIHVGKNMTNIETIGESVIVTCADGTKYEGTMVLGADGASSVTRSLMQRQASHEKQPMNSDVRSPFTSDYRAMWCSLPRVHQFTPGQVHVVHGDHFSIQVFTGLQRSWLFLYEKLDRRRSRKFDYSKTDILLFVEKHAGKPVGELKLGQLASTRTAAGMIDLEEGVISSWSSGRIVLVGDSCHKYTPNTGQGLNAGIQDICALTNELHGVLKLAAGSPTSSELAEAFTRYQKKREKTCREDLFLSRQVIRMWTWSTNFYWFLDQWIVPYIPYGRSLQVNRIFSPAIARGLCLDFMATEEPFQGKVPWMHPVPQAVLDN